MARHQPVSGRLRRQRTLEDAHPGSVVVAESRRDSESEDASAGFVLAVPLVVVCHDNELVRAGVHQLLTHVEFVERVDSFSSIKAACTELPRPRPAGGLAIIGGATLDELLDPSRRADLGLPLIVLLSSTEPYALRLAAELIATGYVFEASLSARVLRSALELVGAGETTMPGAMAALLLGQTRRSRDPLHLTPRQQRVLQMIASGATNRAIAGELGLSVHAVKRDVAALLTAVGGSNRTEVTARALEEGLIPRSRLR